MKFIFFLILLINLFVPFAFSAEGDVPVEQPVEQIVPIEKTLESKKEFLEADFFKPYQEILL